jgi:hypothetical protein
MLYREIIAVCSEIHKKHINIVRGQNAEFLNIKPDGTYSDHWTLKIQVIERLVLQKNMVNSAFSPTAEDIIGS